MWESSRGRGKGQGNGNRNGRAARMRMKRIQAHLTTTQDWGETETQIGARIVLNDLNARGVMLFSASPLEIGQTVTLSIEHPRKLVVRGEVNYCVLFELSSKIYCANRFPYRLGVVFEFLNDGEERAVQEYVEAMTKTHLTKAA